MLRSGFRIAGFVLSHSLQEHYEQERDSHGCGDYGSWTGFCSLWNLFFSPGNLPTHSFLPLTYSLSHVSFFSFPPSHPFFFFSLDPPSPLLFSHLILCILFPFSSPHILSSFFIFFFPSSLFLVFLTHVLFFILVGSFLPLKTWGGIYVVWGHYVPHYIFFHIFYILFFLIFF